MPLSYSSKQCRTTKELQSISFCSSSSSNQSGHSFDDGICKDHQTLISDLTTALVRADVSSRTLPSVGQVAPGSNLRFPSARNRSSRPCDGIGGLLVPGVEAPPRASTRAYFLPEGIPLLYHPFFNKGTPPHRRVPTIDGRGGAVLCDSLINAPQQPSRGANLSWLCVYVLFMVDRLSLFIDLFRILQARRTAFVSATGSDDLAVSQCHRSIQAAHSRVSNVVSGQLYWPRSQSGDLTALIFLFFSTLARAFGTII